MWAWLPIPGQRAVSGVTQGKQYYEARGGPAEQGHLFHTPSSVVPLPPPVVTGRLHQASDGQEQTI